MVQLSVFSSVATPAPAQRHRHSITHASTPMQQSTPACSHHAAGAVSCQHQSWCHIQAQPPAAGPHSSTHADDHFHAVGVHTLSAGALHVSVLRQRWLAVCIDTLERLTPRIEVCVVSGGLLSTGMSAAVVERRRRVPANLQTLLQYQVCRSWSIHGVVLCRTLVSEVACPGNGVAPSKALTLDACPHLSHLQAAAAAARPRVQLRHHQPVRCLHRQQRQ